MATQTDKNHNSRIENPYRIFFPISIGGLLAGLTPLFLSYTNSNLFWHKELLITLFLLPAAAGFLFTATPRFTGTQMARKTEVLLLALNFLLIFVAFLLQNEMVFQFLKLCSLLQLLTFFLRRWINSASKNQHWPPFIITGLAAGLSGALLQVIAIYYSGSVPELAMTGNRLYYEAQFWILLSGIGVRFFPMITQTYPPSQRAGAKSLLTAAQHESASIWYTSAVLLLLSFILEAWGWILIGTIIRLLVLLFIGYEGWAILEKPKRAGSTTTLARIFMLVLLAGHFIFPFFPGLLAHLYHIMFIGGFLSLTLMVATRVTLSHEQAGLLAEQQSWFVRIAYPLFLLSLVLRIAAIFLPKQFLPLIRVSAGSTLLAILLLVIMVEREIKAARSPMPSPR